MKRTAILVLTLLVGLLAACGGAAPVQEPAEPAAVLQPEATVTPTLEPTATLTPTIGSAPVSNSDRVVFGLQQRLGEGYEDLGVYLLDITSNTFTQIAPAGWNLQAVSGDGSTLLINNGQELYRAYWDGSSPQLVVANLYPFGRTSAIFVQDAVAYIGGTEDGTAVFLQALDESPASIIVPSSSRPIELLPSPVDDRIFWNSGTCTGEGVCSVEQTWQSGLDGNTTLLEGMQKPRLTLDGTWLAYSYLNGEGKSNLAYYEIGTNQAAFELPLPGDILADFAWSPDGTTLAVIRYDRSDYDGKVSGTRVFLFTLGAGVLSELPEMPGLNHRVLWSPDGIRLLFTATELTDTGSRILVDVVTVADRLQTGYTETLNLSSSNYLFITNIYWLANH